MSVINATTMKLLAGVLCALSLALLIHDRNRWKGTAVLRHQQVLAEKSAHAASIANYRAAAEAARRADEANAQRVRLEQAAINERTAHDYERRIAAARARSDELRGAAGAAPLPALPGPARGIAEGTGEGRLLGSEHRPQAEIAPLLPDDALIATEQAIQLDELIKWVRRQSKVSPSD